jgi:hypothetical protein
MVVTRLAVPEANTREVVLDQARSGPAAGRRENPSGHPQLRRKGQIKLWEGRVRDRSRVQICVCDQKEGIFIECLRQHMPGSQWIRPGEWGVNHPLTIWSRDCTIMADLDALSNEIGTYNLVKILLRRYTRSWSRWWLRARWRRQASARWAVNNTICSGRYLGMRHGDVLG